MPTAITLDELRARLDLHTPPILVEALPPRYYADAHLPGAINIPHDAVDRLAPELLPDRDAPVVVYCASGRCTNSGIVARPLEQLGYRDVADYHEGKAEWMAAGLPTQAGAAVRTAA